MQTVKFAPNFLIDALLCTASALAKQAHLSQLCAVCCKISLETSRDFESLAMHVKIVTTGSWLVRVQSEFQSMLCVQKWYHAWAIEMRQWQLSIVREAYGAIAQHKRQLPS